MSRLTQCNPSEFDSRPLQGLKSGRREVPLELHMILVWLHMQLPDVELFWILRAAHPVW
jgi:hypothetical protein